MYDVVCIYNRGSNRGWADIHRKALWLFVVNYVLFQKIRQNPNCPPMRNGNLWGTFRGLKG